MYIQSHSEILTHLIFYHRFTPGYNSKKIPGIRNPLKKSSFVRHVIYSCFERKAQVQNWIRTRSELVQNQPRTVSDPDQNYFRYSPELDQKQSRGGLDPVQNWTRPSPELDQIKCRVYQD